MFWTVWGVALVVMGTLAFTGALGAGEPDRVPAATTAPADR
jgi:hypothetical protein